MVIFPNCKINLGLNVIRKRGDGYHDIETFLYPLKMTDALEVVTTGGSAEHIHYSGSGLPVEGKLEDNLCIRAWKLLRKDFERIPPVAVHLHKTIPPGAGLGGGSADGAFMLTLLNQKFQLGLSTERLVDYAMELGSDCPFFIINRPCLATGRGELLEPVQLDLSAYKFVLVNPGISISTPGAFSSLTLIPHLRSIKNVINQPCQSWRGELTNDFESQAFTRFPEINGIKEQMYDAGAIYSSMSGTGSTVYGLFEKDQKVELTFPPRYFWKELPG